MSLKTFFEGIFPFLFNALQRAWDSLTPTQQAAVTNSGLIGQLLKNNLSVLGDDLVELIVEKTDLPKETVQTTLITLAAKLGFTGTAVNDAITFLQTKLSGASSNEDWNGLLKTLLIAGGEVLSGGTLNWGVLALGIGEWVYQNIITKKLPSSVISTTKTVIGAVETATKVADELLPGTGVDKALDEAKLTEQVVDKLINVPDQQEENKGEQTNTSTEVKGQPNP